MNAATCLTLGTGKKRNFIDKNKQGEDSKHLPDQKIVDRSHQEERDEYKQSEDDFGYLGNREKFNYKKRSQTGKTSK